MAEKDSRPLVAVFGGYGVFGSLVARELAERGFLVSICGRDPSQAERFARQLGAGHQSRSGDVRDRADCRRAIEGHRVVINCAGPFAHFDPALLDACLETGCHYVDIADDRRYAALVRDRHLQFAGQSLTAAYGCSSLPSISCALALIARADAKQSAQRVRCTLFIGNNNPKGHAAATSAARQIGKKFTAPQGMLRGFRDSEFVSLPRPFGRRRVLNFESPDYDLLPDLVGTNRVLVKVGFESRLVTSAFGVFARCAPRLGRWLLPKLAPASVLFKRFGCAGGAVMSELLLSDGTVSSAALVSPDQGQRMAILPCVYAAQRLCQSDDAPRGAVTCVDIFGARQLVDMLVADGNELHVASSG